MKKIKLKVNQKIKPLVLAQGAKAKAKIKIKIRIKIKIKKPQLENIIKEKIKKFIINLLQKKMKKNF
jgi:hypothetical protein